MSIETLTSPNAAGRMRGHFWVGSAWASSVLVTALMACSSSTPITGTDAAGGHDAGRRRDGSSSTVHADACRQGACARADGSGSASRDAVPEARASGDAADGSAGCGASDADTSFTCTGDGNARVECSGGRLVQQACPNGCLREPAGQDSICMGTTSNWSCTGSYGTTPVDDGNYYLTEFGCWLDDAGVHTDPDDNCIPACLSKAQAAGLCDPNGTGPECEEKLGWYAADGARFGCLQRLRVTNPKTGRAVIAIALDYGPGCAGENSVQHAVLDSSGLVNDYLFGGAEGASDRALVHVVEVDDTTPLGPVP